MARKKTDETEEQEGPVGVLSRQGDEMNLTSENDLAKSEDYNPEDDIDYRVSGDGNKPGVLENRPNVSDEQGIDDILRFTGSEDD